MMNDWSVTTLRFTAFFEQPVDSAAAGWWASVVGAEPDEASSRKSDGTYTESGPLDERVSIEFKSVFNRFDAFWQINPKALSAEVRSPSIGTYAELESRWLAQIARCLEVAPPSINRIALGTILDSPAMADRVSAYERVLAAMPITRFDPSLGSDYNLQVNFATDSAVVPGLAINRVSKWNCIRIVAMTNTGLTLPERHHARAELDFNTGAEHKGQFEPEQLSKLVNEVAGQIRRVIAEGGQCLLS